MTATALRLSVHKAVLVIILLATELSVAQAPSPASIGVEERIDSILNRMTLDEKIDSIGGVNQYSLRGIPRLGVPEMRMADGPLGIVNYPPSTAYPSSIAIAASWDTELARRVGASLGQDARARGIHFLLAPGMNIYRAPMCGRNFEYLGEDPYLASRMAVSIITGIQKQGVVATAKHFAGNNQEYDRNNISTDVDERTLREIYLPAFEASVKEAHVGAVMDAYNLLNGVHMTQNGHLNNDVLKQEWGFNGILMSDWDSTHDGVTAANGGLDLEMPSGKFMNRSTLLPAIAAGKVSMATIDDKLRRILRTEILYGFLDRQQTDSSIPLYSQQAREVALEAARAGMVLLKNSNHVLPLDKSKVKTITVVGPDAYPPETGGGGSSHVKPFRAVSYLEGISNYLGTSGPKVLYAVDTLPLNSIWANSESVTAPGGAAGLKGEYFDNQDLQGSPVLVRTDPHVAFHWGDGSFAPNEPADHFSARWTGYYVPQNEGDFVFYVSADDGYRLYLNDRKVIDDWVRQSETLNSYTAHLEAGKAYKIRLEYFEAVGSASVGFGVIPTAEVVGHETKAIAAKADVVIVCVGFDSNTESEGADRSFRLPGGQDELIRAISRVNPNTIVVVTAGGNVDMTQWLDQVSGLIQAWYPGQEGGTALAQIIFGDYSPSGKLPASFEKRWEDNPTYRSYYPQDGEQRVKYSEGIFVGYRHYDHSPTQPQFAFGCGLSYTTFQYSHLSVSPGSGDLKNSVAVSFDVTNRGRREGAEVAEVYVGATHPSVPRPVKELKGFSKIELKPGETRRVTVSLDQRAFSYYDVSKKDWNAEPGDYSILVGGSSDNITLQGKFTLER